VSINSMGHSWNSCLLFRLFFLLNLSSGPFNRKANWCAVSIHWHLAFARSRVISRARTRITSHAEWISELYCVCGVHVNFLPLCLHTLVV